MWLLAGAFFKRAIVLAALVTIIASYSSAQVQQFPVDDAAASRGQQVFASTCAQCHAADARGSATGPDLLRSVSILHGRAQQSHGTELMPLLQKPNHTFTLTQDQVADISQFLTRAINRVLRSGQFYDQPSDLLSGDVSAGEAYFNGAGGCNKCHSPTADLVGIGRRMAPPALQQRFLFPQTSGFAARGRGAVPGVAVSPRAPTKVTATPARGPVVSGTLLRIDDFNVTLQDSSGNYRTIARTADTKVEVSDPYAAHVALLDKYTDADIHNLTAYLETLK